MRFAGLALHDAVPDAKTIWLDREQLTRACALARLFARFDAMLAERGFLAMGGQIVDASVVEARRPLLTKEEKAVLRGGGTPADWSRASAQQIDRDGRWTRRRGRKTRPPEGGSAPRHRRRGDANLGRGTATRRRPRGGALVLCRRIAAQRVPGIPQPAHHVLPPREKLASVTEGRRAAVISAPRSTASARPSSSRLRYSTVRPSKVTRVVPPV